MDVRTLVWILFLGTIVSACSPKKASEQVFNDNSLMKADGTCASAVIRNEFVVAWNDGRYTLEKAETLEEFKTHFLEKNYLQVRLAEYNVRIQRTPFEVIKENSLQDSEKINNWGQDLIEANYAWNMGYKGQGILVGVVDSQVEFSHPQLANQSYTEGGSNPTTDPYGRGNFTGDEFCDPTFDEDCGQHGTHVAGIIAGTHLAGGIKGIAPLTKVIGSTFLTSAGDGTLEGAVNALRFAEAQGAKIINASWGADNCSKLIRDEFVRLESLGLLLVAAAGNGDRYGRGFDIFSFPVSPASFNLNSQITVAAATQFDFKTSFSNFSFNLVHLAAPGEFVYSTIPVEHGSYAAYSGTSMAAPFVSGAAAVLWSAKPSATAVQVKRALLESVDVRPGHEYQVVTRGRLNLKKAVQKILAL